LGFKTEEYAITYVCTSMAVRSTYYCYEAGNCTICCCMHWPVKRSSWNLIFVVPSITFY